MRTVHWLKQIAVNTPASIWLDNRRRCSPSTVQVIMIDQRWILALMVAENGRWCDKDRAADMRGKYLAIAGGAVQRNEILQFVAYDCPIKVQRMRPWPTSSSM